MTVAELIAALQKHDPDRLVVMASDAEGNNHSPIADLDPAAYRSIRAWWGEVGLEPGKPIPDGYSEEDVIDDGVPCLVLVPVN